MFSDLWRDEPEAGPDVGAADLVPGLPADVAVEAPAPVPAGRWRCAIRKLSRLAIGIWRQANLLLAAYRH